MLLIRGGLNMFKHIVKKRECYIIILTIILWGLISTINENFARPTYLIDLIGFNSVYFICALGVLPLMIKGSFDLSMGGMISAVSILVMGVGSLVTLPFYLLLLMGSVIGIGFGLINGYIIGRFKVPAVVVTLAMMNVYYGFSRYLYRLFNINTVNMGDYQIELINVFGLSIEVIIIILMMVMTFYMLRYSPVGRSVYAFGGNKKLATRKGYKDFATTIKVHGFSGLSAGIAATIHLLTFNAASIDTYKGIEFELIIIVIIGGLNVLGGYGSVLGTFVAGLFLVVLKSGLVFTRIPVFWHDMLIGLIIILLISYDMFIHRRRLSQYLGQGE